MSNFTKHIPRLRWLAALTMLAIAAGFFVVQRAEVQPDHESELITAEQAVAIALNGLEQTRDGIRVSNPNHSARFTSEGVYFTPRKAGPDWRWQLAAVGAGDRPLAAIAHGAVQPVHDAPAVVRYHRGGVIEQYVLHANSIEQQFVIPQPLALGGDDLVIRGEVASNGRFEKTPHGWQWVAVSGQYSVVSNQYLVDSDQYLVVSNQQPKANSQKPKASIQQPAVTLGDVTVFDADGAELPATMHVTATGTRITVQGAALATAAYPVTIDPEIGANDFRVSDMGPEGDDRYNAIYPAVAFNWINREYLVVWEGANELTPPPSFIEYEIYGQRIDGLTGAEVGNNDFRISDMGPDGDPNFNARMPAVAYNAANHEYLVVWQGDDNTGALVLDELEIFGQRIYGDRTLGDEVGNNDFRISDMGPDGSVLFEARGADVVYNSLQNEYLVVWYGDDNIPPLVDNDLEIFGQRIHGDRTTGDEVGANDFRISDMDAVIGFPIAGAGLPAVDFNPFTQQYLVVWQGDDNTPPMVAGEIEIFGQLLLNDGSETGANDFRISVMGNDAETDSLERVKYDAFHPDVVFNSMQNDFLVVWHGDDDAGGLVDAELEIWAQAVSPSGALLGSRLRISDMGADGDPNFGALDPSVAFSVADQEYLVVWWGDDNTSPLVDDEYEIFGQRLDGATRLEVGDNDFRLSDMGIDSETDPAIRRSFSASFATVAWDTVHNEYLIAWAGIDSTPSMTSAEAEIYAQRFGTAGGSVVFKGLLNTPEGQAQLAIDGQNRLVVSNIGLSKLDGVAIAVDDGAPPADSAISVLFDPLELGGNTNPEWLSWQGKGVIDGAPGVFGQATLEGSNDLLDLSADFSGVGATTVQVRVFKAGLLQGSASAPNGIVGQTNPCFLVTDKVEVSRLSVAGETDPCYIVGFENLVEFTDLQNNMLVGDEIRLSPVDATANAFDAFDVLSVLASGVASFTIDDEFLALPPPVPVIFSGLSQVPTGAATLSLDGNDNLVVSNIGLSKLDGVSIAVDDGVPPADSVISVLFDPLELGGITDPCYLSWQGKGVIDGAPGVFGQATLEGSNDLLDLSADFSGVGATSVQVRVFKAGLLQGKASAPNGIVGQANPCFLVTDKVLVDRLGVAGETDPCMIVGFENLVEFTDLQNNMLVGDEIRLSPVAGPPIDFGPIPKTSRSNAPRWNIPRTLSVHRWHSPLRTVHVNEGIGFQPIISWRGAPGNAFQRRALERESDGFASSQRLYTPLTPLKGGIGATATATATAAPSPSLPLPHSPSLPVSLSSAPDIDSFDTLTILAAGMSSLTITDETLSLPPSHFDFVLSAEEEIEIDRNVVSEGAIHSNDEVAFERGGPGTHTGNVTAVGDIKIEADNTIIGNVLAGDDLFLDSDAVVSGTALGQQAIAPLPLPVLSFTAGGDDITVPKHATLTLAPGSYGKVKVEKRATLVLSAGDYFVEELDTDKAATLAIDLSAGLMVRVNATDEIEFDKKVQVVTSSGQSGSLLVTFISLQKNKLEIQKGATVLGTIVAANAKVSLEKTSRFRGAICAKKINVDDGVPFLHHDAALALPKAVVSDQYLEDSNQYLEDSGQNSVVRFELAQNYPNPFNPSTVIRFQLPVSSEVRLAIYNLRGQLVRQVASGKFASGKHEIVWDATDDAGVRVASGLYVYRISAGDFVEVRKMVLMK